MSALTTPSSPPAPPGRPRAARTVPTALASLAVIALTVLGMPTAGAAVTPAPVTAAPRTVAAAMVSSYWLVASDGGIFAFGGAPFYGSTGNIRLSRPVVGMAATSPTDFGGYREVASDGGIFDYGDATFYGSTGNIALNRPIVGMAATPSGHGYWLVASDGGIFAFGDATFYGSTGNIRLNSPVVAMKASATGHGYYLTAADGGVFDYGDAQFHGSLGGTPLSQAIVGSAVTADQGGYWFANNNGAVTPFGDATYWGSTPQVLAAPVVGITEAVGTGSTSGGIYPSGSFGYDISYAQCPSGGGVLPPAPYTIGMVQVEEPGYLNPCLAQETRWAGGGLNLYIYANYGTGPPSGDGNCASFAVPAACDYGFSAAIHAFDDARVAGVNTAVPWWLDVEDPSFYGHQSASAGVVQGMIDGLHYAGINSVGIYASPGNWTTLVGSYAPPVPFWVADWGIAPQVTCQNVHSIYRGLPTGPVAMVQYSSPSYPLSLGGMDLRFDDDYAC